MAARQKPFHRLPGGAYVVSASRRDARTGDYAVGAQRREGDYEMTRAADGVLQLRFVERHA